MWERANRSKKRNAETRNSSPTRSESPQSVIFSSNWTLFYFVYKNNYLKRLSLSLPIIPSVLQTEKADRIQEFIHSLSVSGQNLFNRIIPLIDVYGRGFFALRIGCCLDFSCHCSHGGSDSPGSDKKLKLIISSFNELLSKGHTVLVKKNGSTETHGAANSTNSSNFVNRGLLLWNQDRQKWIGNKKALSRSKNLQLRMPKFRILCLFVAKRFCYGGSAAYNKLLRKNKQFPRPIPLSEMVEFLVDIWEQEGL